MSRDPGLQPERTRLAWRRTLLAVTAVLLLEVRLVFAGDAFDAVLAGLAVVAWLGVLVVDWRRATGAGPRGVERWSVPLTALAAAGLALLGVLHVVRGLR
ncbi:DUF202 domain-containing protein [Micromonospora sp. NPDC004551]|uniref:DUF202 domain-containing protein n=1 Tax=Micromonospora sp. NPDC004551 TaxID=3154284 RepID=UPI0033A8D6E0